jgi:prepilin-type N-terminal cleavage/methylation domain-containing protein
MFRRSIDGGGGDRGETLIELVVAVVILGIAAVSIVFAMTLSVKTSDIDRKEATAGAAVRNYAETIENLVNGGGYVAGTGAYPAYTPPSGYTASASKLCWTASSTWATCTASNDIGLQQLTLTVASNDARASEKVVIVVRKPCAPGQTTCT